MIRREDIKLGASYRMLNGMVDIRVIGFEQVSDDLILVKIENISGKNIGLKRKESIDFLHSRIKELL
jgi:hypothetical protein